MNSEYIIVKEYCTYNQIEPDFVVQLEDEGLIEIKFFDDERYIHVSQLSNLEQYTRWHYELSVNIAGIDVMQNLLNKINEMQGEIDRLKQQIKLIDSSL